jgi:hypothetical protein
MHSSTSNDSRLLAQQSAAPSLAPSGPGTALQKPPPRPSSPHSSRYRRRVITSLLLLLALVLLLAGGIAFSLGPSLAFFAPGATITLTPQDALEQQSIMIKAVTGSPHQGQAQARLITASTQTSRSTVPATGNGHQSAQSAIGKVTFYNLATYSIAIPAGITLTGRDGVQIVTDAAAQVPAGNPPALGHFTVKAHAVQPGPAGDIAAGDIDVLCCANGIVVKNDQPFGGGQDTRTFTAVAQADIEKASAPLISQLTQQAQAALLAQVRPGEKSIPPSCTPQVLATPLLGQEATQVTVSVSVTCRSAAYNAHQVDSLAAALFQQQESAALGSNYALAGQVTASEELAGITEPQQGTLVIPVAVRGLWIYQIDRSALRALARQLAGKDPAAARAILLRIPGVTDATIQLSGWNASTLPTDSNQIVIVIAASHKP